MQNPKVPRNKAIVALRDIWNETHDRDFSLRKIGEMFSISHETVVEIVERFGEEYGIKHLLIPQKKIAKKAKGDKRT